MIDAREEIATYKIGTIRSPEMERALRKSMMEHDWSPGDVVDAEEDGAIVLDDGISTWNPIRAAEFLEKREPYGHR